MIMKEIFVNIKLMLYTFFILVSALTFSAINFNNFFKKEKIFEAKVFFTIISIISGYLLTNFVIDFLNLAL